MTVDRIDIICDDWHHARGKIAKIQTFAYYADIDSWVDVPYRGRSRAYQHTGEHPTPFRPNVVGARAPLRHRYACELCAGQAHQRHGDHVTGLVGALEYVACDQLGACDQPHRLSVCTACA